MSASRRKQNRDITRIVGILFMEIVGAIVLINLAGFAHQQRSGHSPHLSDGFEGSEQAEKSLPKVVIGRYNGRW